MEIPKKKVKYSTPRSTCAKNVVNAIRHVFVPVVIEECQILAIRCIFNDPTYEQAKKQLAARRRQMETCVLEYDEVSITFLVIANSSIIRIENLRLPGRV